jgi:hypothetical protein
MTERKTITDSELIYSIEGTPKTPSIFLDASKGIIKISGTSIIELYIEFYRPIVLFIQKHFAKLDLISCEFRLQYFNSSSSKCIIDILKTLERLYLNGTSVTCKWYYDKDDEVNLEFGEDYQSIMRLPIDLIEIPHE